MEKLWHCLLVGCILIATVCGSEDATRRRQPQRSTENVDEHEDELATAEDHEHHRIIIVVPKEVPHHVNHVHTYKLADKGIPLIHSGKVVHDHKHNGKVTHEHGHAGKSTHSHKHTGAYGHQHKHVGHMGHKHLGHFSVGQGHHGHLQQPQYQSSFEHYPLLSTVAQKLNLQQQQQQQLQDNAFQYRDVGGSNKGVVGFGPVSSLKAGRAPGSGSVNFVPSSPRGLGSFMPSEIQQYVDGRHGPSSVRQQQQQYGADDNGQGAPRAAYDVIHLRVPDENGPNMVKHLDIDLANNVARLQTAGNQQPFLSNFKTLPQQNTWVGLGRAKPTPEDDIDAHNDDEDVGGGSGGGGGGGGSSNAEGDGGAAGGGGGASGGDASLEDGGYRFGEGYKLAMSSADARDFFAAQELNEEDVAEDVQEPNSSSFAVDDHDTNAYSRAYVQY